MPIKKALEPTESARIASEVNRLDAAPAIWAPPHVEHREWTRRGNMLAVSDVEPHVDPFAPQQCTDVGCSHKCRGHRTFVTSLPPRLVRLTRQHQQDRRLRQVHPAHSTCRGR